MTASLVAIAAIGYLVFKQQHEDNLADTRRQGVSLVRVLAGVPMDQLVPGGEQQSVLNVLRHGANSDNFAYLSVVANDGRTVNEVTADGLLVPASEIPTEPASWLGERTHALPGSGDRIIEFHAPLLDDGELQGFVRLGYRYPAFGLGLSQVPFLAAVALPVFLLVPLFYALLRLEIKPLRAASDEIGRVMDGQSFQRLEIAATGELGDFMQRFNHFVERAGTKIGELERDQQQLITSTKLLTYRKNRIETVLETLPEAVLILDEAGAITFANTKLASMFNVSQERILSQAPPQWCDNPDVLQLLSKLNRDGRGPTFNDTIRFSLNTQAEQSIVTKTYPLFAPNKPSSAIGTLIIFRDETKEALARQARSDFVAHLSHELKSPLNVLSLYSETMLSDAGRSEEFRVEAANVISEEVSRLSTLISGLLSMTQIENGSLTPDKRLVKLTDVATAAFDEAKGLATDKKIVFRLDVPREMNPVSVDKDLIRIAITNLLSNAVKYNRDDGTIELKIQETDDAIQIRVSDTGIGIGDKEAAKIFDKFYRSSDERVQAIGGHGLGLALTKQIIELHHGSLSLDRDREEGTEFIINLWKEAVSVRQAI
ncbi:MAG: ATP-binding protein [Woeseiaceae bacterium]|nr:ATP-binding protein [Woeseiaceae bacterium]